MKNSVVGQFESKTVSSPRGHNFARPHKTLSKGTYPTTPAMVAGVADHVWSLEEIAALLD